jgi:hypothetical protein
LRPLIIFPRADYSQFTHLTNFASANLTILSRHWAVVYFRRQ